MFCINKKEDTKVIKILFCIAIVLLIILISTLSFADVGSFERYDSGGGSSSSSSSSGSWSSSSDWGSSRSGRDYDYSGTAEALFIFGGAPLWIILIVIILAAIYSNYKARHSKDIMQTNYVPSKSISTAGEPSIEGRIKAIDPLFSGEKFLSWSKKLFITLQNAWTKRDWEQVRIFESDQLFEQHSKQLQEYIDNKKINVMEEISVIFANLAKFEVEGEKEILSINLKSTMKDYIIDENTGRVLEGDKTTDRITIYRLTFMRKAGVKTKEDSLTLNANNCPNCGAPLKITMSGKCEYCNSIITNGEHGWVLVNLEVIEKIR